MLRKLSTMMSKIGHNDTKVTEINDKSLPEANWDILKDVQMPIHTHQTSKLCINEKAYM